MSDLIDRQALLKQIDIDSDGEPGYYGDTWKFIDTIKSMPHTELSTNLAEVGTDCISRQAAIDIAPKLIITLDGYEMHNQAVTNYCAEITQLPPAQPEPHWIPVTEATPTEDDDYWATFDAETGRFVDWASWYQGRWVVWIEGSPAPLSNVIAWCKPIEPYKGVTE